MKTISLTAAFTLLFFTASFAGNIKKQQDPKAKKTATVATTTKPAAKSTATAKPATASSSTTTAGTATASSKPAAKPSPASMRPAHKTREKAVAPIGTKKPSQTSGTSNFSRSYKGKHHLFHHHHAAQSGK